MISSQVIADIMTASHNRILALAQANNYAKSEELAGAIISSFGGAHDMAPIQVATYFAIGRHNARIAAAELGFSESVADVLVVPIMDMLMSIDGCKSTFRFMLNRR
jgi:hypothetical protein